MAPLAVCLLMCLLSRTVQGWTIKQDKNLAEAVTLPGAARTSLSLKSSPTSNGDASVGFVPVKANLNGFQGNIMAVRDWDIRDVFNTYTGTSFVGTSSVTTKGVTIGTLTTGFAMTKVAVQENSSGADKADGAMQTTAHVKPSAIGPTKSRVKTAQTTLTTLTTLTTPTTRASATTTIGAAKAATNTLESVRPFRDVVVAHGPTINVDMTIVARGTFAATTPIGNARNGSTTLKASRGKVSREGHGDHVAEAVCPNAPPTHVHLKEGPGPMQVIARGP